MVSRSPLLISVLNSKVLLIHCEHVFFIRCEKLVSEYLDDSSPEGLLDIGADMRKIQYCYQIMKVSI